MDLDVGADIAMDWAMMRSKCFLRTGNLIHSDVFAADLFSTRLDQECSQLIALAWGHRVPFKVHVSINKEKPIPK